jgi:GTPase SAR1 family protein
MASERKIAPSMLETKIDAIFYMLIDNVKVDIKEPETEMIGNIPFVSYPPLASLGTMKRIVLLGPEGAGKSSITRLLCDRHWKDKIQVSADTGGTTKSMTIYPTFKVNQPINSEKICIMDTVGLGSLSIFNTGAVLGSLQELAKHTDKFKIPFKRIHKIIFAVNPSRLSRDPHMQSTIRNVWKKMNLNNIKKGLMICINWSDEDLDEASFEVINREAKRKWTDVCTLCDVVHSGHTVVGNVIQMKTEAKIELKNSLISCDDEFDIDINCC